MSRIVFILPFPLAACAEPIPSTATPSVTVDTTKEAVAAGKLGPSWESLNQ